MNALIVLLLMVTDDAEVKQSLKSKNADSC